MLWNTFFWVRSRAESYVHLLAWLNAVLSRLSVCSACAFTRMLPICLINLMTRRSILIALIFVYSSVPKYVHSLQSHRRRHNIKTQHWQER